MSLSIINIHATTIDANNHPVVEWDAPPVATYTDQVVWRVVNEDWNHLTNKALGSKTARSYTDATAVAGTSVSYCVTATNNGTEVAKSAWTPVKLVPNAQPDPPPISDPLPPPVAGAKPVVKINILPATVRMAPASVHVECSQSVLSSGTLQSPKCVIAWSFGDSSSPGYANPLGGSVTLSEDQRGSSAGYAYANPGTYKIVCSITDESGAVGFGDATITIAPDTRVRRYVSPSGNSTNSGLDASHPWSHAHAVVSTPSNSCVVYAAGTYNIANVGTWRTNLLNTVFDLSAGATVQWTTNPTSNKQLFGFGAGCEAITLRGGSITSTIPPGDYRKPNPANSGYGLYASPARNVTILDTAFPGTYAAGLCYRWFVTGGSGFLAINSKGGVVRDYGIWTEAQQHVATLACTFGPSIAQHQFRAGGPELSQFFNISFCDFVGPTCFGKNSIRLAIDWGTVYCVYSEDGLLQLGYHYVVNGVPKGWIKSSHIVVDRFRMKVPQDRGIEILNADNCTIRHSELFAAHPGRIFGIRTDAGLPNAVADTIAITDNTISASDNKCVPFDLTDPEESGKAVAKNWTVARNMIATGPGFVGPFFRLKSGQLAHEDANTLTDHGDGFQYGAGQNWSAWQAFVQQQTGKPCSDVRSAALTPASVAATP